MTRARAPSTSMKNQQTTPYVPSPMRLRRWNSSTGRQRPCSASGGSGARSSVRGDVSRSRLCAVLPVPAAAPAAPVVLGSAAAGLSSRILFLCEAAVSVRPPPSPSIANPLLPTPSQLAPATRRRKCNKLAQLVANFTSPHHHARGERIVAVEPGRGLWGGSAQHGPGHHPGRCHCCCYCRRWRSSPWARWASSNAHAIVSDLRLLVAHLPSPPSSSPPSPSQGKLPAGQRAAVEKLDYEYVRKCTDARELESIVLTLRSGLLRARGDRLCLLTACRRAAGGGASCPPCLLLVYGGARRVLGL